MEYNHYIIKKLLIRFCPDIGDINDITINNISIRNVFSQTHLKIDFFYPRRRNRDKIKQSHGIYIGTYNDEVKKLREEKLNTLINGI